MPTAKPPTARRRGRPGHDLESVLAGAVAVFNERGFDGASIEDLSKRLGISKSAIYHHVESKDALLALALDRALVGLEEVADEVRSLDGPAVERLDVLLRSSVGVLVDRLPYVTLLLRVRGNSELERKMLRRRRRLDALVADLVKEAVGDGDLRPGHRPWGHREADVRHGQLADRVAEAGQEPRRLGPRRRSGGHRLRRPARPPLRGTASMCWSAPADVVAGCSIVGLGALGLGFARTARDVPLAALPLLLGAHQLIEARIWSESAGTDSVVRGPAVVAWTAIAYAVLPTYVPAAVLLVERSQRRIQQFALVVGLAVSALLVVQLTHGVEATQHVHVMDYGVGIPWLPVVLAGYLTATCLPFLASREPLLRQLGTALALGAVVAVVLDVVAFASVWCALAAVVSLLAVRRTALENTRSPLGVTEVHRAPRQSR